MEKSKRNQIIEIVIKAAISVASVLLGVSLEALTSISQSIINLF